ncbi:MAG: phosphoribosylaminoimidazolesuccinocarboxamide synthase [Candidatus Micrarchaeota archaeon]
MEVVTTTDLPLPLHSRGKVRDTYDLGDNLLMIATDRLSAFDVVFSEGIPCKGAVLTELSLFWFEFTKNLSRNHLARSQKLPPSLEKFSAILARRSMIVEKAKPLPIECVVRGYLAGSGWKEYREKNTICGIKLPAGLKEAGELPEPLFTPATKATTGHDINITEKDASKMVDNFEEVREKSIKLYASAAEYARRRGIIIADTKFEFGMREGELLLIDEVLTPDSSRFWPADKYSPGSSQPSFDKQYVRDYLEKIGWSKSPPPPSLPKEIIGGTSARYIQAYEMLTGKKFER